MFMQKTPILDLYNRYRWFLIMLIGFDMFWLIYYIIFVIVLKKVFLGFEKKKIVESKYSKSGNS